MYLPGRPLAPAVHSCDLEAAERVFGLLMGNDVAPREEFISRSAAGLDRSRLDI
ncbi:hypothetical protein [Streptomyces sp. CB02923]|uniref:hypothetical protein n=1 Tax=Streptomyces sp. CB02923 TaxID=1718985 RepID=UPI001A8CE7BB|nr:hypothetical protein [Streptomyces sp. CB02923]